MKVVRGRGVTGRGGVKARLEFSRIRLLIEQGDYERFRLASFGAMEPDVYVMLRSSFPQDGPPICGGVAAIGRTHLNETMPDGHWVATPQGLYYANLTMHQIERWVWEDLLSAETRSSHLYTAVHITLTSGTELDLLAGKHSSLRLMGIVTHYLIDIPDVERRRTSSDLIATVNAMVQLGESWFQVPSDHAPLEGAASSLPLQHQQERDRLINARCQELVANGVPQEEAAVQSFVDLARPHILASLAAEEAPILEGRALHEVASDRYAPAFVVLTARRAVFAIAPLFDTVIGDLAYETGVRLAVNDFDTGERAICITYRPIEYPNALRKLNPSGELDATFIFSQSDDQEILRRGLVSRLGYPYQAATLDIANPREMAFTARRLDAIQGRPVSDLELCPICFQDIADKTRHASRCTSGFHAFADPGFRPVISDLEVNYGDLLGEEAWRPTFQCEAGLQSRTTLWVIKPKEVVGLPLVVPVNPHAEG
jgi:hypothetical protein